MIESIELIQNIPQKGQLNRTFSKKGQRNRRFSRKGQHVCWVDWLIRLKHLSQSFDLIESIHMYLVTWLNWLIYSSYTDSWWLNQYIFTFCHDWVDWFGMSRIQVCIAKWCSDTAQISRQRPSFRRLCSTKKSTMTYTQVALSHFGKRLSDDPMNWR